MSDGYEVLEWKAKADHSDAIRIPRSTASTKKWVKIAEFADLALGVTHLAAELAWDNPTIKPPNIKAEYRKAGGSDPSKRKALNVGTERSGADAWTVVEKVDALDLPMQLWIWHDAPRTTGGTAPDPASDLLLTKVIVKAHNPKAEIAGDLGS